MSRRSAPLLGALVALLLGALPAVAAASEAGSVTHRAGAVSATLPWEGDRSDSLGVVHPQLAVTRSGVRYDITVDDVCGTGCVLLADDPTTKPTDSILKVFDLDGDGEPEVLLDTFSGGAHCCLSLRLYRWTGAGYARTSIDWGDVSYALRDLDGDEVPELVGSDPIFSAAFTAYAASSFPPLVLRWNAGRTENVTRRFPGLVRTDLARQRALLRKAIKRRWDVKGVLAALVADEYLLDRGPGGLREVDRQRRARRVGKGYKKSLLRFLRRGGYR